MKRKTRRKRARVPVDQLPERDVILDFLGRVNKPRGLNKIAEKFGIQDENARSALEKRLLAMQRDGQIIKNRRAGYALVRKMDMLRGHVIAHPDGYGFFRPDEEDEDLYLSPREMRRVLHNDRVLVRVIGVDKRGRKEGALVEILERANRQVIGRYYREGSIGFVVPENRRINQDILVPDADTCRAGSGQYVVARIIQQPDQHTQPIGEITEILGSHMSGDLAVEIAVRSYEIPCDWPEDVVRETGKIKAEIPSREIEGRIDIRDLPLVTIDGEDARDFDDAVYCEKAGKGWRLLVAIADVSHYVHPGSALDRQALDRGNSVYFPNRVIPMLPEILSNELCSLKPAVDRLCMVCEMHIDGNGEVKNAVFQDAIMQSAARMTYTDVSKIVVDRNATTRKKYHDITACLDELYALYRVMHGNRKAKAVIEFSVTETKLEFDEERKNIRNITALERTDAHRLIEEFMLAANVAAAKLVLENELPALFRVHEPPKAGKIADLHTFLAELGLSIGGGDEPATRDYAQLIEKVQKRDDRHLIETVLLRSMPLAIYSNENKGHFGLGFDVYGHFTSPIRRYPDLVMHRAIRSVIQGTGRNKSRLSPMDMHAVAEQCSMTERRADEATREVIQWYKCSYMEDRVGEEFTGIISSVTSFGVFVELDDIYIEGLVHITSLPIDYYHYDPVGHRLRGERRGRTYRLGNRVRVKVIRVDTDDRKIDFELAG